MTGALARMGREVLLPEDRSGDQTSSHTKPRGPGPEASDPSEARAAFETPCPQLQSLSLSHWQWSSQSRQRKWRPGFSSLGARTIVFRPAGLPASGLARVTPGHGGLRPRVGPPGRQRSERLCSQAWGLAPVMRIEWDKHFEIYSQLSGREAGRQFHGRGDGRRKDLWENLWGKDLVYEAGM